jgi:aspartyl-tRNA(Asn)/glutamyl-tRNA(Gln) amidotransferase subunit A
VGISELDPTSLPRPAVSYRASVRAGAPGKLRIAYSPDLGYAVVQSDVAAAVEDAVGVFRKLGHTVEQIEGGPPEAGRAWGLLGAFLLASHLEEALAGGRDHLIGRGLMSGIELARREMNTVHFGQLAALRAAIVRWCASIFDRYDLLLTPTVPFDPYAAPGPYPQETEGRAQPWSNVGSFTIPFNLSWHPAATVRVGLSRRGLPMGMQIVAARQRDDLVLQAARTFERERPWHSQWAEQW